MKQTEHYQLNLWDGSDRILRTDFNADNAKLDTALAEQAAAIAKQAEKLAKCGNCQFYYTSYVGTGTYGEESPCSRTFPHKPMMVTLVEMGKGAILQAVYGCDHAYYLGPSSISLWVSWSGNTMRWYDYAPESQMNRENTTYLVLALLALDQ